MTIYDALSQEYGLLIYHDYLLDNNHELLSEMCLSNINEFEQLSWARINMIIRSGANLSAYGRSWSGSLARTHTLSNSRSKTFTISSSRSGSRLTVWPWSRAGTALISHSYSNSASSGIVG